MIVVDTGVLLAVADQDDRWHIASQALLDRGVQGEFSPWPGMVGQDSR